MEITPLAQTDQMFRQGAEFLGLGIRGFYLFVLKQRGNQIAQHGLPVARRPSQFSASDSMTHGLFPYFTLGSLFHFRGQFRGRPALELHAQAQSHFSKNISNFIQGLPAEVLGLEHFSFRLLH